MLALGVWVWVLPMALPWPTFRGVKGPTAPLRADVPSLTIYLFWHVWCAGTDLLLCQPRPRGGAGATGNIRAIAKHHLDVCVVRVCDSVAAPAV